MNNRSLEKQPPSLFPIRFAAVAGLAAAAILFVNAAKRAGLIEITSATQLVAPLAQALAIILVGSILYCSALLRDGKAPRVPVVAYAIAAIPIALRNFVPELVLDSALALLGASVIWLALWMLRSKSVQAEAYHAPS